MDGGAGADREKERGGRLEGGVERRGGVRGRRGRRGKEKREGLAIDTEEEGGRGRLREERKRKIGGW